MEIVVVGTHEYEWAVRVFARQFNLHWDPIPVTYWCDRPPETGLPPNFAARRVPAYSQGSWPWDPWYGAGLRSIMEALVDDQVAIFLPDHWLYAPVDKHGVRTLLSYMHEYPEVVRGNLVADSCLDIYGEILEVRNGYRVVQVPPSNPHCSLYGGMAGSPAIWNRKALLDILEPHWSMWSAEKLGTDKMAREWPRRRSMGVVPGPVRREHGLRHKIPQAAFVGSLDAEARAFVASVMPGGWRLEC